MQGDSPTGEENIAGKQITSVSIDLTEQLPIQRSGTQLSKEVSEVLDNDIVTQYFRGQTRSIITYQDEEKKTCSHEKIEQSFAAIMVGVIGFKDLYSAWENQIISTIPDYKAEDDSDYKVEAEQSEYLEVAPKVICL